MPKAYRMRPENTKYGYTVAFYEYQAGNIDAAIKILKDLTTNQPSFVDGYAMLGDIYEKEGKKEEAKKVYQQASDNEALSNQFRSYFRMKLNGLQSSQ